VTDDDAAAPPDWLALSTWKKLYTLEKLALAEGNTAFQGLGEAVTASSDWRAFNDDDSMLEKDLPGGWDNRFNAFQRLLVVKSLRENFLQLAVRRFVAEELGRTYVLSPPFDLAGCFKDSQKTTPLIFVLSAGADPTDALLKLARDNEYLDRLQFVSLGQGQGEKAENLIHIGRQSGDWVCLQNCHLANSWMPALERIQELQDPNTIDDMYRLWLTSMPSSSFPVPVLQGGIKITNEPPKGLRANLSRTFQEITPDIYEGCSKSREFKKTALWLSFFPRCDS